MLSINNNLGGLKAQVALAQSNRLLGVSLERLSTGVRINRAEDDSAGVTVRDGFQAQVLGLEEGIRNIQSAHGTITVAEQALNKVTEALQVMRSLAVRAADDNLSDDDRDKIQLQIRELLEEIDERAARTEYNGHKLLDGSISEPVPERLGSAKLQSNSFLADGSSLVTGALTTGTAARTINAISQGSYQVRLVHSQIDGTIPQATANTYVTGTVGSGPNGDGLPATATLTQTLTDRNGGAHTATIVLTQVADGSRSYTYNVSVPAGGLYPAAQSFAGTLTFDADGGIAQLDGNLPGNFRRTVTLPDGSTGGQPWTLDFARLTENPRDPAVAASATSDGSAGNPTASITGAGVLATGHDNSDLVTTPSFSVFDRTGAAHAVSLSYTRVSGDATGETWSYRVNGLGDQTLWTGVNSGSVSGTLSFNPAGALTSINGATPAAFAIEVGDGTDGGHTLSVDLTVLAVSGAVDTVSATQVGGAAGSPTTVVALSNNLVAGGSPDNVGFELFDRTGTDLSATDPTVTTEPLVRFIQVGSSNVWTYTITPPAGSGYTGAGTSLLGEVRFDDAGRLVELDGNATLTKSINFGDGTRGGHSLQIDFSALGMARPTDLSPSSTDGGVSDGAGDVDAVIYFSDGSGNTNLSPVSTLYGVDLGARAYNAGGISFSIHQAATLDVGLTSYVKAYTYASGTVRDDALQFVTGANEDQISRVGIARMDVQALFRLNESFRGSAGYTDLTVDDELKAQDLIGQIDDALTYAGSQNLKIGATANALTRLLSLQRENHTAISGAFMQINDADVALESTRQARRSILVQSGTAMVAQANSQAQYILQLLR